MASWWSPNDYFTLSTIDPAKLHEFEDFSEPEAETGDKMVLTKRSRPNATKVPPIPKISAQWDPTIGDSPADWHKECWKSTFFDRRVQGWQESYFCYYANPRQHLNIHVPLDPLADDPYDEVVIDMQDRSIYDAYMLRTDIAKNENLFRRLQVVFRPLTPFKNRYMLFDRTGRVGLQGECVRQMDTLLDLDRSTVVQEFRKLFRQYTGVDWRHRYQAQERPTDSYPSHYFTYIDLDYSREVRDVPGFVQSQVQLPNYQGLNRNLNGPVRLLMEAMLYGGPVASLNNPDVSIPGASFSPFTAPYHTLSLRSITAGFQTLKRIAAYLDEPNNSTSRKDPTSANAKDKPEGIRWKTIVQASSRYRSEIPFCDGWHNSNRPVVISNYYTLFLELRFLYSLCPEAATPEILNLIDELPRRGSLQVWKHGHALTVHPLYQAYSSLPHGFQPLTDTSSLEFREIQAYLHNSCQEDAHRINFEIQGIYRVFTKTKAQNPYHDWLRSTKADQSPSRRNRLLLWHGTPLNSLLGILETGLQIRKRFPATPPPPAPPPPPTPKRARVTKKLQSRTPGRTNSLAIPPPGPTSALYNPPIKPGILQRTRPKPAPAYVRSRAARAAPPARQRLRFMPGGSMFGDGIYLADASSKSANYCGRGNSYWGAPPPPPPPPALVTPGIAMTMPTAGRGTKTTETNDGTEAILLLCEADVGTKDERVRSLFSIPDGQEVVREFQEKEAQRRELLEKEAEKDVAMEVDGGFEWTRQKVGDFNGGGSSKSEDDDAWLDWGNKKKVRSSKAGREREGKEGKRNEMPGGKGTDVRCIEGVGRTGPRDTPDGWKKVPWNLGWDWNRSANGNTGWGQDQQQQHGGTSGVSGPSDYGDVWMPDTSKPYGLVVREATLAFNEYVIYNPAHVQIRYILRIKIKENRWR